MLFRSLQPADAAVYRQIRRTALSEVPQFVGPLAEQEALSGLVPLQSQLARYPGEGNYAFGFFFGTDCAAVAVLTRKMHANYAHKLFLWGMFVRPDYRGRSIGRHFLTHLLGFARQQPGVRFVSLQVTTTNAPAKALYRRHGFETYGVEPQALLHDGSFYDFEMMQLDLAQPARNGSS
jgi:ribosomal protein S18 acetylase RimI-like enzyme